MTLEEAKEELKRRLHARRAMAAGPEYAKAYYLAGIARERTDEKETVVTAKLKVQIGDIHFEAEGDPTWLINTLEAILDRYDEPATEPEGDESNG